MHIAFSQTMQLTSDHWWIRNADSSDWLPCELPANQFSALFHNQAILDPYFGDHEKKLAILAAGNWEFKKEFSADSGFLSHNCIELTCDGIDTYCAVYLNGVWLGNTTNAFVTYRFPVKHVLKPGSNELMFSFRSAKNMADSLFKQQKHPLPGESRVFVRKPQFHFGWDFGPEFVSSGIHRAPVLRAWNDLRIEQTSLHTLHIYNELATLRLQTIIQNNDSAAREIILNCKIGDREFSFTSLVSPGSRQVNHLVEFDQPDLWWPRGSGDPYLYECRLTLQDQSGALKDEKKWKTGIRTAKLISESDERGHVFYFEINGEKIFCKGSNYIPPDILFDPAKKIKSLLRVAVESHFNMLRIWGGGRYESEEFYEICDSLGIMIWQDFMFACAMYPGDSAYLENVRTEVAQQVQRISKHPCLVLFCGNNENNEGWHRWGWQDGLDEKTKNAWWTDYENLFRKLLPEIVQSWAPEISYWESSPLFGRGDKRFMTHGDAHDWGLWHDEMPFEDLENRVPRFMSEFGFQSLPGLSTIRQFANESDLDPESAALTNHQKHPRGNKLIKNYLARDYPEPKDFESLIYLNQLCQARGISKIIHAHRRSMPYCMGSLYWQFNDCWPGISWSGVDYFGKWKALQHAVKSAFAPVLFTAREVGEGIEIRGINDTRKFQCFQLELTVQDFSGNPLYYQSLEDTIPANTSRHLHQITLNLDELDLRQTHYLLLKWIVEEDTVYSSFFFEKPKNLLWLAPNIRIEKVSEQGLDETFQILSDNFVGGLYLKESIDFSYFPNFIDLHPGIPVQVVRKSEKMLQEKQVEFMHLFEIR